VVVCYTGNGPTSEANARLIAAAPELYEALDALLKGCAVIAEKTGINAEAECLAFVDSPFARARLPLSPKHGERRCESAPLLHGV
jgi:hypothetical protein